MHTQSVPPKISSVTSLRWFAVVILSTAIIGAGATVFFFNPDTHRFYPICLFHQMTGWNCPGCGATRAMYELLHGKFQIALKDNLLFVLASATTMIWAARITFLKMRNQPTKLSVSPKILWGFLAAMIVFGVLRNLPGFEWLSP